MKLTRLLFIIALMGCTYHQQLKLSATEKDKVLDQVCEQALKPAFGGKIIGDFEVLEYNSDGLYVWTYLQEFYQTADGLQHGTGISVPMHIKLDSAKSVAVIEMPRDGSYYSSDINRIFRGKAYNEVQAFSQSQRSKQLIARVEAKGRKLINGK